MKEIRYYIKQVLNFPLHSVNLDSVDITAIWNDARFSNINDFKLNYFQNVFDTALTLDEKVTHLILAYLVFDKEGELNAIDSKNLKVFLLEILPNVVESVKPYTEWMKDSERAEELVRVFFDSIDVLPANETKDYFTDRLKAIDTRERIKILEETKKAQERTKEVLRKLKEKEDEEAASKYNRE